MPALSAHEGGSLAKAASVCLTANTHRSPVALTVRGDYECGASITLVISCFSTKRVSKFPVSVTGAKRTSGAEKKIKLEQTQRSDALQIPAIVVIVEFSRPMAEVVER
jgi:hypothetical protein